LAPDLAASSSTFCLTLFFTKKGTFETACPASSDHFISDLLGFKIFLPASRIFVQRIIALTLVKIECYSLAKVIITTLHFCYLESRLDARISISLGLIITPALKPLNSRRVLIDFSKQTGAHFIRGNINPAIIIKGKS
jgi:hypothetical protein